MEAPGRTSGVLLPLFSVRGRGDFGVGDFGCLDGVFDWLQMAGQKMFMTLPLLPTTLDGSPYSTRSAFGLNPLFIDARQVLAEHQVELEPAEREQLELARASTNVRYDLVFPLKLRSLERAFEKFRAQPAPGDFTRFAQDEAEWLDDWALFAAVAGERQRRPGGSGPSRSPSASRRRWRRRRGASLAEVLWQKWLQWVAAPALGEGAPVGAREGRAAGAATSRSSSAPDSADCWCHPELLRRDARLGVPPDDFSDEGQDWGLPWFDFDAMAKQDYHWLRFRGQKAASYYDLRRVDHAIGYFRQWIRDAQAPKGRFVPPEEPLAAKLGEQNFQAAVGGRADVAEDLGVIPRLAREVLERHQVPGYKVMRWAREDGVYRTTTTTRPSRSSPPAPTTPRRCASGGRRRPSGSATPPCAPGPSCRGSPAGPEYTPQLHEALLRAALQASSGLCILPWQDVFAERDRVNLPGTVGASNWSYRVKVFSDELTHREDTARAALWLKKLTVEGGRA